MLSTETIYKIVYDYARNLPDIRDLEKTLKTWEPIPPTKQTIGGAVDVINLLALLQADIREKTNKADGKGNLEKAMRAIIKNAPESNRALQGFFLVDNLPAVCDGYRIIRAAAPMEIGEPVVGMPQTKDLLNGAKKAATAPLELPTLSELKAYVKIKKAENASAGRWGKDRAINWIFKGENAPAVNAAFLLDMLTAFPDAKAYHNGRVNPLYFESEAGEGVLLPVRLKEGGY